MAEPWYNKDAEPIDKAIEYSNLSKKEPVDGILINQGTVTLNPDFNNFDTHIFMCYEYSDCQLLEPENDTDDIYGVLICRSLTDIEEDNS